MEMVCVYQFRLPRRGWKGHEVEEVEGWVGERWKGGVEEGFGRG